MSNILLRPIDVISFGTIYLDLDFLQFPFTEGLFAHRETIGNTYALEVGGSAFNFAKVCANLELEVLFSGKIAKDPIGEIIKNLASTTNVKTHFIQSDKPSVQTNIAAHYVHENGTSIMTSAGSANQHVTPDDLDPVVRRYLPDSKYLYLGGGLKLLELLPWYPSLIKTAKGFGVKVILDHGRVTNMVTDEHKKLIQSIITDVDIYLPSKDEFLQLWSFSTVEQGLSELENNTSATIIIKDSVNGCYTVKNGHVIVVAPPDVSPINTIGAGDSFNAGYIKADILDFETIEKKMRFASAAAALKISTNALPTLDEINAMLAKTYV